MLLWIDWPRQQGKKQPEKPRKGKSVTLEFQNGSGGSGGSGSSGDSGSNGIPAGNRGQGDSNKGKSIKEWRAGRGAV
jgi:hypothetical protein